jgi:hypothetical protein
MLFLLEAMYYDNYLVMVVVVSSNCSSLVSRRISPSMSARKRNSVRVHCRAYTRKSVDSNSNLSMTRHAVYAIVVALRSLS